MRIDIRVTPEHIKAEAERRILARFPLWKQLNLIREGGSGLDEIDAIRAVSNDLERTLPSDYTSDHYWKVP